MEKIAEKFYLMYYFLMREDPKWAKVDRVPYMLETALGMFLACFVFTLLGVFNVRNVSTIVVIVALVPVLLSWLIVTRYYLKTGRDLEMISRKENYPKKQRRILAVIGLLIFITCFCLMFCGGILMSNLWSLHPPRTLPNER